MLLPVHAGIFCLAPRGELNLSRWLTVAVLLAVALGDRRRWHWQRPDPEICGERRVSASLIAWSAVLMMRVQVAGLYLQSSTAKLSHAEWANGTALYYWLRDPSLGAPSRVTLGWRRPRSAGSVGSPGE
jgi:hypothetical protein